jgi:hypothetical protein
MVTLEDTFGRSLDAGISLYGGPSAAKGNLAWGACMPVTLTNEGRRVLVVEYLSVRDSTEGT